MNKLSQRGRIKNLETETANMKRLAQHNYLWANHWQAETEAAIRDAGFLFVVAMGAMLWLAGVMVAIVWLNR